MQGHVGLGEIPDATQRWFAGAIGPENPGPRFTGTADCIANGERYPLAVVPTLINGFNRDCFAADQLPPPDQSVFPSAQDRFTEAQFAAVLDKAREFPSQAIDLLKLLFPDWISVSMVGSDGELAPPTFALRTPNFSVVAMPGSSSDDQLVLQIASVLAGPEDMGILTTSVLWWQQSTVVIDRLTALGVDYSKPIFFTGHSYGAVLVTLVAARLLAADRTRRISLLTFGMPRCGDERLFDLLIPAIQMHLANQGDPVPSLPPESLWWKTFAVLAPLGFLTRMDVLRKPRVRAVLFVDGSLVFSQADTASIMDYFQFLKEWASSLPYTIVDAHMMPEYLLRLSRTPPP